MKKARYSDYNAQSWYLPGFIVNLLVGNHGQLLQIVKHRIWQN